MVGAAAQLRCVLCIACVRVLCVCADFDCTNTTPDQRHMAPGVGAEMVEARERRKSDPVMVNGSGDAHDAASSLKQRRNGANGHAGEQAGRDSGEDPLDFDVEIPGNEAMRLRGWSAELSHTACPLMRLPKPPRRPNRSRLWEWPCMLIRIAARACAKTRPYTDNLRNMLAVSLASSP